MKSLHLFKPHRYSHVPSFGSSGAGIRHFPDNVSEMKKMAARDFEDLMQVSDRYIVVDLYLLTHSLIVRYPLL